MSILAVKHSGMQKVTTRTSKPAKLLMLSGVIILVIGIFGLFARTDWSLTVFVGGFILWLAGRLIQWWSKE